MLRYTCAFQNYENKNDNLRGDCVVSLSYINKEGLSKNFHLLQISNIFWKHSYIFGPLSTIIDQSLALTSNSYNQNLPKQALTFTLLVLDLCYLYVIFYVLAYKYMSLLKNYL